jgi:putative glutathione S-transferase
LIVRALKGLEAAISYTVVDWFLGELGWTFTTDKPLCEADPIHGFTRLRQVYGKDKTRACSVSAEQSDATDAR